MPAGIDEAELGIGVFVHEGGDPRQVGIGQWLQAPIGGRQVTYELHLANRAEAC